MPRKRRHRTVRAGLSPSELEEATSAYAAGATFPELAARHGIPPGSIRRVLDKAGVLEVRRKPRVEIPSPDLMLLDWRSAGLSCRQIAAKYGLSDHRPVAEFLRKSGVDVHSRPARRKVPGVVLGAAITDRQARLRRRPPLVIAPRTQAERRVHGWTPAELEAIAYELAAGRVTFVPRGRSGLTPGSLREAINSAFRLARQRADHAARAAA